MIDLYGVSKVYGKTVALHPTDLIVAPRKTTVVIGPSGCGKSTLLRIIIGLVTPSTGTVLIGGEELSLNTIKSIRLRTGYVIQQGGLFPHMTARANVTLMARFLRWEPWRIGQRIAELADLVHLPPVLLDRYPGSLSGGECQRVSIMRALILDPDILLMDEPLSALDPMIRFDLQKELRSICTKLGKTVLMVTHDMAEAAYFADAVVLLRGGRVMQQGTVEDLVHAPANDFVQSFMHAQRSLHQWP